MRVISIWFNPWQHQGAATPLVALLHELRAQLTFGQRLLDKAKKVAQTSFEAGLPMLAELIDWASKLVEGPPLKTGDVFGRLRSLGEAYEAKNFETRSDAQRFNLIFEQAVARLLGENIDADEADRRWCDARGREVPAKRLVIFIDDLDRCSQAQVVALLESIKLYLQTRYCVFVLGMDASAARKAVESSLPGSSAEHAQEYLEKLFRRIVPVPVPGDTGPFLQGLLGAAKISAACSPLLGRPARAQPPQDEELRQQPRRRVVRPRQGARRRPRCLRPPLLPAPLPPRIHRLLTYDPDQAAALHEVILADQTQAMVNRDPVRLLFLRAFRHALPVLDANLKRAEEDAIVNELIDRLDRHKGDTTFLRVWKEHFGSDTGEALAKKLRPILVVTSAPAPVTP